MERKLQPDHINQTSPTKQTTEKRVTQLWKVEIKEKCSTNASYKCFSWAINFFVLLYLFHVSTNPGLLLDTDGKVIKSSVVIYKPPPRNTKLEVKCRLRNVLGSRVSLASVYLTVAQSKLSN